MTGNVVDIDSIEVRKMASALGVSNVRVRNRVVGGMIIRIVII